MLLAVILTLAINISATRKYAAATKAITVIKTNQFIPVGEKIDPGMVKIVDVPEQMAQGMETDMTAVVGRSVRVSVLKDQYLMQDDMDTQGKDPGCVEIFVPVNVPGGAWTMPGDYVDVWQKAGQNIPSVLLVSKVKVLHTVDSGARETAPSNPESSPVVGSAAAVAVGIEVPDDQAVKVVGPASQNQVYLVKSSV